MAQVKHTAQGSISLTRLRSGDTLGLRFNSNGKALYQAIDPEDGSVFPSWAEASHQPVITPVIISSLKNPTRIVSGQWKYNGTKLQNLSTELRSKFEVDSETYALRIKGDLASKTNISNDQLEFECNVEVLGYNQELKGSVDIIINQKSGSSYFGFIQVADGSAGVLSHEKNELTLSGDLLIGGEEVESTIKWHYKDQEVQGQELRLTRDDVDGMLLVRASFYIGESLKYTAGFRVVDIADNFTVVGQAESQQITDNSDGVRVSFKLMRGGSEGMEEIPTEPSNWTIAIYRRDDWETPHRTIKSNTATVTREDTDYQTEDGFVQAGVEVIGTVKF